MVMKDRAYNELYLKSNIELHRLLFLDFTKNKDFDFFSLVDAYMQTSKIREGMDKGSPKELNKGDKQLLNSIDYSKCIKDAHNNKVIDYGIMHWMADIYCQFQWYYKISSKEINYKIPSKELYRIYFPLHETSEKNACEKIYQIYFINNQKSLHDLSINN